MGLTLRVRSVMLKNGHQLPGAAVLRDPVNPEHVGALLWGSSKARSSASSLQPRVLDRRSMDHLVAGVREAVERECWYAALSLALMIPDACAAIERPGNGITGDRYATWVDTYFAPHVTAGGVPFLTGRELYRLRCRFLHQAEFWLSDRAPQDADSGRAMFEVLNEIILYVCEMDVVPSRGMSETATSRTTSYSVAVRDVCEWICLATEAWLLHARVNAASSVAIDRASRIHRMHMDGSRTPI